MAEAASKSEVLAPNPTRKVDEIAKQFLVKADESLAHNLQEQEFGVKYEWNRGERRTARQDVPLAKQTHTEEEERLQRERFEQIRRMNRLAEQDAEVAKQVQEKELLEKEKERMLQEIYDQKMARLYQLKAEKERKETLEDDEVLARQFQERELLEVEKEKLRQEIHDQKMARRLQLKEQMKFEVQEIQADEASMRQHHGSNYESGRHPERIGETVIAFRDFQGFQIPEGISPAEQRELLRLQDEELARVLQEHEEKKARKHQRNELRDQQDMEQKDAELARIMFEMEKLKAQREALMQPGHPQRADMQIHQNYHVERSSQHGVMPTRGIGMPFEAGGSPVDNWNMQAGGISTRNTNLVEPGGMPTRSGSMQAYDSSGRNVGMPAYDSSGRNVGMQAYDSSGRNVGMQAYDSSGRNIGMQAYDSSGRNVGMQAYDSSGRNVGMPAYNSSGRNVGMPLQTFAAAPTRQSSVIVQPGNGARLPNAQLGNPRMSGATANGTNVRSQRPELENLRNELGEMSMQKSDSLPKQPAPSIPQPTQMAPNNRDVENVYSLPNNMQENGQQNNAGNLIPNDQFYAGYESGSPALAPSAGVKNDASAVKISRSQSHQVNSPVQHNSNPAQVVKRSSKSEKDKDRNSKHSSSACKQQ